MDIAYLHIGMMKTASTYMQNIWLRDNKYCLSHKGNIQLVNKLRNSIKRNKIDYDINPEISVDQQFKPKQKIVVSNEGLSLSFLNEKDLQSKIPNYIDYSSDVFGQLSSYTDNLLIVVREPISWIKSIFNQSIKQWGYGSAQEFIDQKRLAVKYGLDLRLLLNNYAKYFNNIFILPFEILKENENDFWFKISEAFQVPLITARFKKTNKSFSSKETYLLSKMNEFSSHIYNSIEQSTDYNYKQEKENLLKMYAQSSRWLPRRFIEFTEDSKIEKMYDIFGIDEVPSGFFNFKLPEGLTDSITENYISVLEDYVDDKYVSLYKQEFYKYISKN